MVPQRCRVILADSVWTLFIFCLQKADEVQSSDPKMAYYCRLHAAEQVGQDLVLQSINCTGGLLVPDAGSGCYSGQFT